MISWKYKLSIEHNQTPSEIFIKTYMDFRTISGQFGADRTIFAKISAVFPVSRTFNVIVLLATHFLKTRQSLRKPYECPLCIFVWFSD